MDGDVLQGFGKHRLRFVKGRDDDAPPNQRANVPSGDLLRRAYCTQDVVHCNQAGRASKSIASPGALFAPQDSAFCQDRNIVSR
jgi:hypothetical protein